MLADVKTKNIMIVDHLQQPLRAKVIDFGLDCDVSEAQRASLIQTRWCRDISGRALAATSIGVFKKNLTNNNNPICNNRPICTRQLGRSKDKTHRQMYNSSASICSKILFFETTTKICSKHFFTCFEHFLFYTNSSSCHLIVAQFGGRLGHLVGMPPRTSPWGGVQGTSHW